MQIWQIGCRTEEIMNDVVSRCQAIDGCEVLFIGKETDGDYAIIKSLAGPAITTPAIKYYGKWEFPELRSELLAKYTVVADIRINTSRT